MLTREKILEIDQYCLEHKMSQKRYFEEHDIPRHQYYIWKRKYRQQDAESNDPGAFIQLGSGGGFVSSTMPPARTCGKCKQVKDAGQGNFLTIELRTPSGTAMRIQGNMSAAYLREIISAGNV